MTLQNKRVCLDPGHPSEIGIGTRGKKLTEVGVAWRMALRVQTLLAAEGALVRLTKGSERETVTNQRRAQIANDFGADLLVRLHCDAAAGSGTATFFPDRQGVSARSGARGPTPDVIRACVRLAPLFHRALIAGLNGALADKGVQPDTKTFIGGKQGALTGSIHSRVPVVLVEMCVLTNGRDEAFLASPAGFETMARAIMSGIAAALKATQ